MKKKRYIQPEAEFDEIEDELLYKASWESETTTKENPTTGPSTEASTDSIGWWN